MNFPPTHGANQPISSLRALPLPPLVAVLLNLRKGAMADALDRFVDLLMGFGYFLPKGAITRASAPAAAQA